jgi:predicted DNA-binding transcriptional regulator AlpA
LYREVKRGAFPAPVQISARLIGWPESVIAAWLASRPAAAPPPPPLFDDQDAPV